MDASRAAYRAGQYHVLTSSRITLPTPRLTHNRDYGYNRTERTNRSPGDVMPLVSCIHCGYDQIVPGAMVNLTVECQDCGEEFVAKSKPHKREEAPVIAETNWIGIAKGAGLVAGLLAVLGIVFFIIVLIVRTPDPKPAPPKLTPAEAEVKKEEAEKATKENAKLATNTIVSVIFIGLGIAVLAYLSAIIGSGIWVARDATARGMSGLGWLSFYLVFQLVGRIAIFPLALIPSILTGGAAIPWLMLAAEPFAWSSLVIYRFARRQGRMRICDNCNQKRLEYLIRCPVCSISSPPD